MAASTRSFAGAPKGPSPKGPAPKAPGKSPRQQASAPSSAPASAAQSRTSVQPSSGHGKAVGAWKTAIEAQGVEVEPSTWSWASLRRAFANENVLGEAGFFCGHSPWAKRKEYRVELEAAAPQVLRFLRDALEEVISSGAVVDKRGKSAFDTPNIDPELATRLKDMMQGLKTQRKAVAWEIDDVISGELRKAYAYRGVIRSYHKERRVVVDRMGARTAMYPSDAERSRGSFGEVGQLVAEYTPKPWTLIAVVAVRVKQRSIITSSEGGALAANLDDSNAKVEEVAHLLQLERQFHPREPMDPRSCEPGDWCLVDWNNLCEGNPPFIEVKA